MTYGKDKIAQLVVEGRLPHRLSLLIKKNKEKK